MWKIRIRWVGWKTDIAQFGILPQFWDCHTFKGRHQHPAFTCFVASPTAATSALLQQLSWRSLPIS
jgi:hypothetical protein